MLTLDLRRGTLLARPRLAVIVITAIAVAVGLMDPLVRSEEWVGWLPTTIAATTSMALWAPSVFAGSAAWIAGQERTHGLQDWAGTARRGHRDRMLPAVALCAVSVLSAQLVVVLTLAGFSWRYGLADALVSPDLLLMLPATTAYLIVCVVIGAALGSLARREFAIPVAALLPYFLYSVTVLAAPGGPLEALAPFADRPFDYVRPTLATVSIKTVFWTSTAGAVVAVALGRHRAAQISCGAAGVTTAVAIVLGASQVSIPGAERSVCAGTAPVTCLDGSHDTAMTRYRAAIDLYWASVPAAIAPAVLASSESVAQGSGPILVAPPVAGFTSPSRLVDEVMFGAQLGDGLFMSPCTAARQDDDTNVGLVLWWRQLHDLPIDGTAFVGDVNYPAMDPDYARHQQAADDFAALDEQTRDAWWAENADAVLSCTATALPTP